MCNFRCFIVFTVAFTINCVLATAQTDSVIFSSPAGFYKAAFTLTLTSVNHSSDIVYTLDGSDPRTSSTAVRKTTPVTINVDPVSSSGRPKTPAFIVRASMKKTANTYSLPETRTYIFVSKVKTQTNPGGAWPSSNVNGQIIYYDMDSKVVNDGRYSADMDDAMLSIPSVSVVTDLANLFNASTGIYVNADGHGMEWERPCSFELINPDGSPGCNINCGLRIRGGWSRHDSYPKHAFRLFFREEYGAAKLEFPLFGEEGTDEYDKIDLRCEQNYSWANGNSHNTMVREVFSRDTQRDMNQPYGRSRYYHLYLNGMYWGIYQTQERTEARFAADYLGDEAEDYDVIKVNTEDYNYNIEATDGLTDNWKKIYNMCSTGFTSNASYFQLEGKDAEGKPVKDGEIMVDIDNLIDYLLGIFYTGNFDAPTSSFMGNSGPNNFYAVDNRNDKSTGFVFFNHDAEHAMMIEPISPGIGLYEDRVNIKMTVGSFSKFHPQWLHYKLSMNPEYRIRFADRVLMHMTGNGALTPDQCLTRFNKRVIEVEDAVIAESARWGNVWSSTPYTYDDTWLPEINAVQDVFIPQRTDIVLGQLKKANLYPTLKAPKISHSGSEIVDVQYNMGGSGDIVISNPNGLGKVYYTTDGSDPRAVGGSVSAHAIKLDGDLTMNISTPVLLKARVYSGTTWSAMRQIRFFATNNELGNLKITEINYHPVDVINGTDTLPGTSYEFIEFKNTGTSSLNLSGLILDSAVYYEFPDNFLLPPGQFYVIATKPKYFYQKYGMVPSGNCKNFFDNSGEWVLLKGLFDNKLIYFYYDDAYPFPTSPDGEGYTLTASEKNPTRSPDDYLYWMASSVKDGSPFADDPGPVGIESIASSDGEARFNLFPNPSSQFLIIEDAGDGNPYPYSFAVTSMTGSVQYTGTFTGKITLDLTGILPCPGMYIVEIKGPEGIQTGKIVYAP